MAWQPHSERRLDGVARVYVREREDEQIECDQDDSVVPRNAGRLNEAKRGLKKQGEARSTIHWPSVEHQQAVTANARPHREKQDEREELAVVTLSNTRLQKVTVVVEPGDALAARMAVFGSRVGRHVAIAMATPVLVD